MFLGPWRRGVHAWLYQTPLLWASVGPRAHELARLSVSEAQPLKQVGWATPHRSSAEHSHRRIVERAPKVRRGASSLPSLMSRIAWRLRPDTDRSPHYS